MAKTKRERMAAAQRRWRRAGLLMDGFLRPLIDSRIDRIFASINDSLPLPNSSHFHRSQSHHWMLFPLFLPSFYSTFLFFVFYFLKKIDLSISTIS